MEKTLNNYMDLSIIIPALNEGNNIAALLKKLPKRPNVEIIVADGGSKDNTIELAKQNGAVAVCAPRGRGSQLNYGAGLAKGRTLLFLHADSLITDEGVSRVIEVMDRSEYCGGAFYLALDRSGFLLKWVALVANLRSRILEIVYGDQGIFVNRELFNKLKGFPETPLMEDYLFFRKLRKRGNIILLKKGLTASSRRWEKEGVIFTTLRNWAIFLLFKFGVSPFSLKKWYNDIR